MKIIFVLGGVISGLGKGVTCGAIGATLKEMGYTKITIKKLDPYLNVDPGTMNPIEHGEVYVTNDGGETDLDLGYYERFVDIKVTKNNSISAGKLYNKLIKRERKGYYLGKTVQLIPHFINLVKEFIYKDSKKFDFIICEIGGSAGDYEAGPFLETVRQIKNELEDDVMICLVTYILYYQSTKELKTKPTQVAIKQLMQTGIQPDILFARTEHKLNNKIKKKLSLYSNIKEKNIIEAINVPSIYQIPLEYKKEGLVKIIKEYFKLKIKKKPTFTKWIKLNDKIKKIKKKIRIAIVGKYVELKDSYYSVLEALKSAGWFYNTNIKLVWINARKSNNIFSLLNTVNGVLVPGGFGCSGMQQIILVIKYCRENHIPFMGICLGMQLSVIEFARNVLGIKNASSKEFGKKGDTFIIDLMTKWKKNGKIELRSKNSNVGGTLRLGSYETKIKKNSLAYKLYKKTEIFERHRHRYEIDIKYKKEFEKEGLIFSGLSPDGKLPEIIEINKYKNKKELIIEHPFFIAVQFHPEFNSTPFKPNPLFKGLIKASLENIPINNLKII